MNVVRWLLDADPAIRWQVMRDLTDEPAAVVAAERSRVAREGWGGQLLGMQRAGGYWGGADDDGWMTTVDALRLLRELGVDPAAAELRAAIARIEAHLTWRPLGNRPFFDGETEPCINGAILAAAADFGTPRSSLVDRLLAEQLADGGWNCEAPASKRSSFHTTICVLEGLLAYERTQPAAAAALTDARVRAQEYLLERRLLRSLRTGAVIDRRWARFAFPTVWHYDVLRGLDYLRSAGAEPDQRVAEAIGIVEQRRHQNGRWPLNVRHHDRIGFELEPGVGRASWWNTLRARRVLRWARRELTPAGLSSTAPHRRPSASSPAETRARTL